MIDESASGYRGPAFVFPVEAGKIHELARAVGSNQPAYLDRTPIAPPVLLKVAQFCWEPAAGSAVARVGFSRDRPPLHARQEFAFTGAPPVAGTVLQAQTGVERIRRRRSRSLGTVTEVTLLTEFRGPDGTLLASARSTSVQPESADPQPERPAPPPETPEAADPTVVRTVGPITQTDVVRYQGASGDLNPVHHDLGAAARAGWNRVLVPGLYSGALLADCAAGLGGAANLRRVAIEFRVPVWLGDTLRCTGSISGTDAELACVRVSDGAVVTTARASFASQPSARSIRSRPCS